MVSDGGLVKGGMGDGWRANIWGGMGENRWASPPCSDTMSEVIAIDVYKSESPKP